MGRLGMTPEEFRNTAPRDLAVMFRGERFRWNREMRKWAWIISWIVSPHIPKANAGKAEPRRIVLGAPSYDPDEEEL